jgi:VWFA-related protein
MTRFVSRLPIAAAVCLSLAGAPHAQAQTVDAEQSFKSSVNLVTIQASVRDKRGRPVQGLAPADFEVRDNGELRSVVSVRPDERSPLSLAVVVDISGSMNVGPKLAMARHTLRTLLAQLRGGEDEVGIFTFDASLHQREAFSTEFVSFGDALNDLEPFGTTSLYDATAAVARQLAARSATRKAVIVITDGIDTSSTLSAPDVSAIASAIDVPVYVVAAVPVVDERMMMEGAARAAGSEGVDLRDLAEWTGGRLLFASSFVETTTVAGHLIQELRQQYVLAIEAAGTHEWRRLDVRVKHPAVNVKARSGYFGG